jgi:uncharacterized membrane protein
MLLGELDGLLELLAVLALLTFAWKTWRRGHDLQERVAVLERQLAQLVPAAVAAAPPVIAPPVAVAEEPEAAAPPAVEPEPAPSPPRWQGLARLETAIAERWMVWLGGLALALGGLFLAGWAIDQGWLGARPRIAAAAGLGLALLALAERARDRRPETGARADAVPAALAAGGLATLYGATLAAHLFYALIGPGPGFALLALVAVCGIGLALRFGPLVTLLGALGAYAAPVVVAAGDPAPWPLFLFLAVLAPALTLLARLTGWTWLLWLHLAGLVFWQVGAILAGHVADAWGAPALHLLLAGGAAAAALLPSRRWHGPASPRQRLALAAIAAVAAVLLLFHAVAGDQPTAIIFALVALSALVVAAVALAMGPFWLAAAVAGVDLLAAASWQILPLGMPTSQWRDPSVGLEPLLWLAPEAVPVATALAVCAAAYAALGAWLARLGRQPGFWAGLAVAVPLLALALAHARLTGFAVSPGYAAIALALAALALVAARWSAGRPGQEPALAAYAIGVVGALALGAALALEHAALTVTLAVLLPACAWVGARLDLSALRRVAWPLAALVLVRLVLAVDLPVPSGEHGRLWLIYAYAMPAVCFWLAARLFARAPEDPLANLLLGGALVAWLLLAAQLIALSVRPTGAGPVPGLAETGLNATAWLATALVLLRWWRREPGARLPPLAAALLIAAAAAAVVGNNLVFANPVLTGEPVGARPILNLLLAGFGLPAALALAAACELRLLGRALPAQALALGGQVLALFWLTLEVRHAFQGSLLDGPTSDGEFLAWSAAWLGWSGVLLALGIRTRSRPLRATALVVASLALAKAFLFDLGELTGLYRAASFLALGLALIAVGWLYRRFVAAA